MYERRVFIHTITIITLTTTFVKLYLRRHYVLCRSTDSHQSPHYAHSITQLLQIGIKRDKQG